MEQTQPQIDPYVNDPTRWATSMAHHAELMLPCLDATGAQLVVEVGASAADLTRLLADWRRAPELASWRSTRRHRTSSWR